ncbi:MAG TPA: hypothetical protein VHX20_07460 [Terracidiphilus sp.]|nr:hypothetical protein [Terracidiphilus sp.]
MEKSDILWEAHYRYNFDRDLYVNESAKKAFSLEFVDDHPKEELRQRILENTDGREWKFYFNFPPSDGVRRELEKDLESVRG